LLIRRFTIMQNPSSPVSSGNISPAIVGPSKDTKEVYLIGGLVVSLILIIGPLWYYSEQNQSFALKPQAETKTDAPVTNLLKTSTTQIVNQTLHKETIPTAGYRSDSIHTDIYFEVGRKGLTDEAKSILATQAEILKKDVDLGLLVQGYTDQQGSASYNKKLGLMRAVTVKEHLIGLGVSDQAITVVSLGKEGVLCIDNSDVCRHMNRRVHLEMRKIGQEHMTAPAAASTNDEETSSPTENLLSPNSEPTPGS
jgi:peptidoglycan-associated lipoprotein